MIGQQSSIDSMSWQCLSSDHPLCDKPPGLCSCNCHKRNLPTESPYKKIMNDIKANSPDMH